MELDETKMWGVTPLDQLWCRIEYKKMRYDGHFTVPGTDMILQNPGATGGFNWGSVSVDEVNNLMIVNPLFMANQLQLIARADLAGRRDWQYAGHALCPYLQSFSCRRCMCPVCNHPTAFLV
jgi:quinate dehydrogenase (quinone)